MMSESIKELAGALAKAQAQLRPAIKDSTNPHFKSKYADLGAIWDACRKALADAGLSVVQMPTDSTEGRVALTTVLLHASGEYIGTTFSTRLQQDSAQGVGSALTYLRRYALASIVGIVADEDDDGNAASQAPRQQATPPPRQQSAPAPAPNGKKPASRNGIIKRIEDLEGMLVNYGLDHERESFDAYSDEQLIDMGKRLKAAFDKAEADAIEAEAPGVVGERALPL